MAKVFGASKDRASLPLLIAAIRDKATPEPVRDEALSSVEAIGSDEALKGLLALLEDNTLGADKQPRVIAALGRFKTADAGKALVLGLEEPFGRRARRRRRRRWARRPPRRPPVSLSAPSRPTPPSTSARRRSPRSAPLKDRASVPTLVEAANRRRDPLRGDARAGRDARRRGPAGLPARPDRQEPRPPQGLVLGHRRRPRRRPPDARKARRAGRNSLRPPCPSFARCSPASDPSRPGSCSAPSRSRPSRRSRFRSAVDLKATYPGFADNPIAWKHARAVDGRGQINLASVYNGNDDQAAFGYADSRARPSAGRRSPSVRTTR